VKVDFGHMGSRKDKKTEFISMVSCTVYIEQEDKEWIEDLFKKRHLHFNNCVFALFPKENINA
jgi:hypothetical protein